VVSRNAAAVAGRIRGTGIGLVAMTNACLHITVKRGLIGLMRNLALDLARDSIRANSLHSGTVNKDMVQTARPTYRLLVPDLEGLLMYDATGAFIRLNALPLERMEPMDIESVGARTPS
jgi:(+)-trans-carveol dehydrogenase